MQRPLLLEQVKGRELAVVDNEEKRAGQVEPRSRDLGEGLKALTASVGADGDLRTQAPSSMRRLTRMASRVTRHILSRSYVGRIDFLHVLLDKLRQEKKRKTCPETG
jgi:hypothetical protein